MQSSLFPQDTPLNLDMPDADVVYIPHFLGAQLATRYLQELLETTPRRQDDIVIFGKQVPQPRLTSRHGDAGTDLHYSGITMPPQPWTQTLLAMRAQVEQYTGFTFNGVLLNYYRDGRDSMGLHSDNEREMGDIPVIPSLSLGAARTFRFKHKYDKTRKPVSIILESGSLLLMQGTTQRFRKHELPRTTQKI